MTGREAGKYRTLARMLHADRTGDAHGNHQALAAARLDADSTILAASAGWREKPGPPPESANGESHERKAGETSP